MLCKEVIVVYNGNHKPKNKKNKIKNEGLLIIEASETFIYY
jgi:hypothetical protein